MELYLLIVGGILGAGLVLTISVSKTHPPEPAAQQPKMVYDYEFTDSITNLRSMLGIINSDGYELIAVTQNNDRYTIIFRRPMHG